MLAKAAEVGAAWAVGKPIVGLWAKSEQVGLMRHMVTWFNNYRDLLNAIPDVISCLDEK